MRATKETNIEYLGRVPDDWDVVPAKSLFIESKEKRHPDDERLTPSQKFGVVSQTEYMRLVGGNIVLADKGLDDWKHVEPNDYIISLRSFQGGLEMSRITGCVTWHYIVLRPRQEIYPDYYKHLFKCDGYIAELNSTCQYLRDGQDLRFSNFVQVPLPIPPITEQRTIAAYLDNMCTEVDRAICAAENSISEYESYRTTFIYQCVTKGLDTARPYRYSGTEWLGSIPADWKLARTKYYFKRHKDIAGDLSDKYDRLALTMAGVVRRSKFANDGLQPSDFEGYQILQPNDLVFKLIDLQNVRTSRVGLSPYEGLVSPAYIAMTPKKGIDARFAEYYFKYLWYGRVFNNIANEGVRTSLGANDVLNLPLLIPSIKEQQMIANYLDTKCAEINAAIAAKLNIVDELKAYRRSLVYEYVTGKREVPCQ